MKIKCSRCGKEITTTLVKITSTITPMQVVDGVKLIPIENTAEPTSEILCLDCFDAYADCINQLNQSFNKEYTFDMVEVVDDVQYGD